MRARRGTAAIPPADDWSEGFDPAPDDDFSPVAPTGPVSLCLACGSEPLRGECPHDEVVTLGAPSAAVLTAARNLARLTQERRAAERALRRHIESELLRGDGSVEVHRRPPPPSPAAPPPPRARRTRTPPEGQGRFDFGRDGEEPRG